MEVILGVPTVYMPKLPRVLQVVLFGKAKVTLASKPYMRLVLCYWTFQLWHLKMEICKGEF